jgi:HSP20 family molecular chaperone IbpA
MTATETKPVPAACCAPERAEAGAPRKLFMPRADVYETKDDVVILADVPGVDEKSVEITLEKDVLTLRGKVAATSPEGFTNGYFEYAEGDYERSFTLGEALDRNNIQAAVKNGVLRVVLPKAAPAKARKIEVKAS